MQKENDTLLVAKLREGNKFAFEALYEKYSACQGSSSGGHQCHHHLPAGIHL